MSLDPDILHPSVRAAIESYGISCRTLACDPALADTAAYCEHYGFAPDVAANAIVVIGKTSPPRYACCLVLATCKLDVNKKVSELLGVKRCSFASAEQTKELTGMEIGGVTPLGLPDMPVYVDSQIMCEEEIVIGGGNRSSKLLLHPTELLKLTNVQVIDRLALPRQQGVEIT
ncbi:MAG TPA: YbaK/EbsC family protein [Candidatus Obscuribacterales bacterium]